ncbi:MAG: transposase [Rubrobacteraceae bacterium]
MLNTDTIRPNTTLDKWVIMPNHLHAIIVFAAISSGSLGSIIGQFKSVCTKRIRAEGLHDFSWQSRFYDRIIRGERELDNVRQYITDNPAKWDMDRENPANQPSPLPPP